MEYLELLFNFNQWSTNNTQSEYKYLTVFVLQKTQFDQFSTKLTSLIAVNALFSKEMKGRSQIFRLNINKFLE